MAEVVTREVIPGLWEEEGGRGRKEGSGREGGEGEGEEGSSGRRGR